MRGKKREITDRAEDGVILAEGIVKTVIRKNPCCAVWTVPVSSLNKREKDFFHKFSPASRTAVVLGHHISAMTEWKWCVKDDGSEHCDADDHTGIVCEQLKNALETKGFPTEIIPYPGECGLQFRSVAQAAGAGEIGINAFLLHPAWGPWIHLRVLATTAPSQARQVSPEPVCNNCGNCISACPAGAIRHTSFDGLVCRRHRKENGEYIPSGPENELRYCTLCADVCPVGESPKKTATG